jgi:hypothetical protein
MQCIISKELRFGWLLCYVKKAFASEKTKVWENVAKDTIFYGVVDIGFVIVSTATTIGCYPMNDGLFAIVLTSKIVGDFR